MTKTYRSVFALTLGTLLLGACNGTVTTGGLFSTSVPVYSVSRPQPAQTEYYAAASSRTSSNEIRFIRARRGDTVYGLAQEYGLSTRELVNANRLEPPYHLQIGQKLVIPQKRFHTVRSGESLYRISRNYGVNVRSLVLANDLSAPYDVYPGQKLQLPPRSYQVESVATADGNDNDNDNKKPRQAIKNPIRRVSHAAKQIIPPRSTGAFEWPVDGRLVSSFGPKNGGIHNDGINIRAPRGAMIRAAENGVVVYAGKGLSSYGNMVLVKHRDDIVTAYAHAEEILVRRGQQIKRGQPVATVGSSGSVRTPQLHFEVRKGRKAVDPLGYLPTTTAQR